MKKYINKIKSTVKMINDFDQRLGFIQEALGRIEARQDCSNESLRIEDHEFRVYSQWGEDGIIQHLIRHVPIENKTFVEFGASNYLESNTRFLLINNNWSGLVMDGDPENIACIKSDPIYWRYNLKAECSFITKENINDLLKSNGMSGDIGLLSIDVDGNDYWVWKAIEGVSPRIVVLEYNSRFGADRAVTVPYDANFVRHQAHHSLLYFGASLKALVNLGKQKGYSFVGCNSNGVNAFFVRSDLLADPLQELSVDVGFVAGKFREARDADGKLLFLSAEDERTILESLPLIELDD
ncbi:hypothetical protein F3F96_02150 [Mariprofundus sp. NF]|uniref:hypothetical protein n=1 Tax=Mariprofundus sp. NF TaxID=2608716 RepID=UPI0015A26CD0|nr:hypothetical protein [Mariprofundus sp. NF]NWF37941.1 hypothetical protein [Mariprofundus sp. NF]